MPFTNRLREKLGCWTRSSFLLLVSFNIFAVSGLNGVLFYDIRCPTRLEPISISPIPNIKWIIYCMRQNLLQLRLFVRSGTRSEGARFNVSGTRLLGSKRDASQLAVYNLPTRQQKPSDNAKMLLRADGFTNHAVWHQACCFAGIDDELAISASDDHKLFIWSLPSENDDGQDQTVDQSLTILQGHANKISCVRYSKEQSAIALAVTMESSNCGHFNLLLWRLWAALKNRNRWL